jgi:hypothetical protein
MIDVREIENQPSHYDLMGDPAVDYYDKEPPLYVTQRHVRAVRDGRLASYVVPRSRRHATCRQCHHRIEDNEQLRFVVPGLAYASYMHKDEATCLAILGKGGHRVQL